jgi:long-chain fatty acid transport protein
MRKWILVAAAVAVVIEQQALANGYKILCVKSAKATAMGEAFITQADDPSAIAFNPAGISQLSDNQVQAHVTLCNAYATRTSPSGEESHNEDAWQPVPSFFATTPLRKDMTAGLGLSFPNGLSSEWADNSFARYVATYSDLVVGDLSPALGVKVSDHLRVGAAVDYYYSQATLERMVDMGMLQGAPGQMDVKSTMEGSGSGWGYNIGAIYTFNPRHAVALTYRAPYTIDYDGDLTLAGQKLDLSTSIDFPAVVVAGYAFRPNNKWKFEVNLDWTDWEKVDDITLDFDTPGIPDAT